MRQRRPSRPAEIGLKSVPDSSLGPSWPAFRPPPKAKKRPLSQLDLPKEKDERNKEQHLITQFLFETFALARAVGQAVGSNYSAKRLEILPSPLTLSPSPSLSLSFVLSISLSLALSFSLSLSLSLSHSLSPPSLCTRPLSRPHALSVASLAHRARLRTLRRPRQRTRSRARSRPATDQPASRYSLHPSSLHSSHPFALPRWHPATR